MMSSTKLALDAISSTAPATAADAPADAATAVAPKSVEQDTGLTKDFVNDPRGLLDRTMKRFYAAKEHAAVSKLTGGKATLIALREYKLIQQRKLAMVQHFSACSQAEKTRKLDAILNNKTSSGFFSEQKTSIEPPLRSGATPPPPPAPSPAGLAMPSPRRATGPIKLSF